MKQEPAIASLQALLVASIDPINQLFFHSHMLRAWGSSVAGKRHEEWLAKMRRLENLVKVLLEYDVKPNSRLATDLMIGSDTRQILESDLAQGRIFIQQIESVVTEWDEDLPTIVVEMLDAERADVDNLTTWLRGPESEERTRDAKFLLPKPGGADVAIEHINAVLPPMMAAVSQFFYQSLIYTGEQKPALAKQELEAALLMMYRAQALLERLIDLRGVPDGRGQGRIVIADTEASVDAASLAVHEVVHDVLTDAVNAISGLADPMTHSLMDGMRYAEQAHIRQIQQRLGLSGT